MTFLSAAAILCLPRQFQITVVENSNESHLRTAGWAFPVYLLLMSLFMLPIALVGLTSLPAGANPDMFVLTLPMAAGQEGLGAVRLHRRLLVGDLDDHRRVDRAVDHGVQPHRHADRAALFQPDRRLRRGRGVAPAAADAAGASRSCVILLLGFLYFCLTRDSDALAPIGLISFAGVAQFLPCHDRRPVLARGAPPRARPPAIAVGLRRLGLDDVPAELRKLERRSVAALMADGPVGHVAGCGRRRCSASTASTRWCIRCSGACSSTRRRWWSVSLLTSAVARWSACRRRCSSTCSAAATGVSRISSAARRRRDDLFFVAERVLGAERAMPCSSLPICARHGAEGLPPRRNSSAGSSANSPARSARPRRMCCCRKVVSGDESRWRKS